MNFLEKLHAHISENGYTGGQELLDEKVAGYTGENQGFLDVVTSTFNHAVDNGYELSIEEFETKYFKFWGKRPNGK